MAIYLSGPRVLTYGELPENPPLDVSLRCPDCKRVLSARRGNYLGLSELLADVEAKCPHCRMALELVRARTVYDVISPEEAESK
jgi:phage FluMu protein Com